MRQARHPDKIVYVLGVLVEIVWHESIRKQFITNPPILGQESQSGPLFYNNGDISLLGYVNIGGTYFPGALSELVAVALFPRSQEISVPTCLCLFGRKMHRVFWTLEIPV
jgi:hypothetical protein